LFDLALPPDAIDNAYSGVSGFCRRYGFLDKPVRVRFRVLDPAIRVLRGSTAQDITLTCDAFAHLDPPVSRVFISENEINFLAFPLTPAALVIFGSGYGFEHLARAAWLQHREVYYWGDIDTHGFAILNQVRNILPHTVSLLMDADTLLAHRPLWGTEPQPGTAELRHLTREEQQVYDQLRANHWGERIRLEQERIGFDILSKALDQLDGA
ncbi:MAG: Wadjet anti-phage system protein JetD domain-containing protein, partial [Desulfuromonadaceae bacterium]